MRGSGGCGHGGGGGGQRTEQEAWGSDQKRDF